MNTRCRGNRSRYLTAVRCRRVRYAYVRVVTCRRHAERVHEKDDTLSYYVQRRVWRTAAVFLFRCAVASFKNISTPSAGGDGVLDKYVRVSENNAHYRLNDTTYIIIYDVVRAVRRACAGANLWFSNNFSIPKKTTALNLRNFFVYFAPDCRV